MNHHKSVVLALLVTGLFLQSALGEWERTNRVTVAGRVGFNTKATFGGLENLAVPQAERFTPDNVPYNYLNGYVLPDTGGAQAGTTWNWGYDTSASQVAGNNILLSRNTGTDMSPQAAAEDETSWGGEVVYELLFRYERGTFLGLQLAGNYQGLDLSDDSALTTGVRRTTYPFAYTPGTTPPAATPSNPYQGTFAGPGFSISDTPGTPFTVVVPQAAVLQGKREVDADLWGLRFGPVLQVPLGDRLDLALFGGLAVGYLDARVAWQETVSSGGLSGDTLAGKGSDTDILFGYYGGGALYYQLTSQWSVQAGAYYQSLQNYEGTFAGRDVEVDFSDNIFVTLGLAFSF
jgi:hypothetical protein